MRSSRTGKHSRKGPTKTDHVFSAGERVLLIYIKKSKHARIPVKVVRVHLISRVRPLRRNVRPDDVIGYRVKSRFGGCLDVGPSSLRHWTALDRIIAALAPEAETC